MTYIRSALATARAHRDGDDEGFSLMETIVAMAIFSVFMSLAMAAIISMVTSTQKSQSLSDGAQAVENVFQRLDHQVRYSDEINPVTMVGANWFVEWHSQATSSAAELCTQLKYDATAKTLLERTWGPTASPIKATPWHQLLQYVRNDVTLADGSQVPFTVTTTSKIGAPTALQTVLAHQQLTVIMVTQPNGSTKARSEQSVLSANFTAVNSTTQSTLACKEVAAS